MVDPYHDSSHPCSGTSGNKALRPRKLVLLLDGIGIIVYVMSGGSNGVGIAEAG